MDFAKLVDQYLAAWNRHDVSGVLALMHKGAAYYDAFWRETCVGRDLEQYLIDSFEMEPYFFRRVGDLVLVESGVVFRYGAHEERDSKIGQALFYGAEVLAIRDDKILTSSDFYCSPDELELEEIARLSLTRHGQSTYASAGLGAKKSFFVRSKLAQMVASKSADIHPGLTVAQFAADLGCTVEQFIQVMGAEYGSKVDDGGTGLGATKGNELLREVLPRLLLAE